MNKIVVFNALQTSLSGGIGRYSYELAKKLYINNPDNIKIVIRSEDLELFNFVEKDSLIIAYNIKNSRIRNIYEQFKLPKIIHEKFPNAIVHYPDTMAPLLSKNKVVITVHDLAFKSLKNVFTWKTVMWKNFITNLSIKKADKIIAITNFTKSEILKHYPNINKNKIDVVYNGFNNFSNEPIIESNIREDIKHIKTPYILTVSTISPRKNIDGLIKAFYKIKDKIEENLVVVGDNGWMYEDVFKLVKDLKLGDRVIFTGKVNDEELKYIYRNSRIFTYLSFYEGFGLPPLEAMSYEIPCIVSNTSSIPEVVGDNAIKVDPYDINSISDNLLKIYSLKSKNNKNNLEKFSWEKCSENTLNSYKKI